MSFRRGHKSACKRGQRGSLSVQLCGTKDLLTRCDVENAHTKRPTECHPQPSWASVSYLLLVNSVCAGDIQPEEETPGSKHHMILFLGYLPCYRQISRTKDLDVASRQTLVLENLTVARGFSVSLLVLSLPIKQSFRLYTK